MRHDRQSCRCAEGQAKQYVSPARPLCPRALTKGGDAGGRTIFTQTCSRTHETNKLLSMRQLLSQDGFLGGENQNELVVVMEVKIDRVAGIPSGKLLRRKDARPGASGARNRARQPNGTASLAWLRRALPRSGSVRRRHAAPLTRAGRAAGAYVGVRTSKNEKQPFWIARITSAPPDGTEVQVQWLDLNRPPCPAKGEYGTRRAPAAPPVLVPRRVAHVVTPARRGQATMP